MRQVPRRRQTPVAAGCLVAALALALLSLVTGGQAAERPVPPALRAAVASVGTALRTADPVGAHLREHAAATPDRGTPPPLPYALLPTALLLAAAAGVLARRGRRSDRPARSLVGAPTGRSPPRRVLAA